MEFPGNGKPRHETYSHLGAWEGVSDTVQIQALRLVSKQKNQYIL
jgi:hypothetical protein